MADSSARTRITDRIWWVPQVLLALALLAPVYRKLAGLPESVALFDEFGFGQWLRYAVGLLELVLAVGLLLPRLAGIAALGVAGTMVGAIVTELYVESGRWLLPSVFLVLALVVAWGRRDWTTGVWRSLRPGAKTT